MSLIAGIPVRRPLALGTRDIFQGLIQHQAGIVQKTLIDSWSVSAQRLKAGGRQTVIAGGEVPQLISFLFAALAHRSQDSAVVFHHHIAELDILIWRHQLRSGQHLLRHSLGLHIHGGINLIAVVHEHVHSVVLIHIEGLRQILRYIVEHRLHIPIVDRHIVHHIVIGISNKGHGSGFLHSLVVFFLCDHSLLMHLIQNIFPALFVVFWINQRRIPDRVVGNGRNSGALGDRAVFDILIEIQLCRCLHPVSAAAKVNYIEISLQNFRFAVSFLKLQGAEYFCYLTGNADIIPVGQVLNELLRQGGTAARAGITAAGS